MTRPRKKSRPKRDSNPEPSALATDALTTSPTRRLTLRELGHTPEGQVPQAFSQSNRVSLEWPVFNYGPQTRLRDQRQARNAVDYTVPPPPTSPPPPLPTSTVRRGFNAHGEIVNISQNGLQVRDNIHISVTVRVSSYCVLSGFGTRPVGMSTLHSPEQPFICWLVGWLLLNVSATC